MAGGGAAAPPRPAGAAQAWSARASCWLPWCPSSSTPTLQLPSYACTPAQNAENEMAIIAAYYGLPTLSVRAAVFHQMLRNQYGYRVGAPACGQGLGRAERTALCCGPHRRVASAAALLVRHAVDAVRRALCACLRRWIACAPRPWAPASRTSCSCLTSRTPTAPPATGGRAPLGAESRPAWGVPHPARTLAVAC